MQQAKSLQAAWQNLSVSSAAQGLKDAQHTSLESLCWAKFGIQSKWQPSSRGGFRAAEQLTERHWRLQVHSNISGVAGHLRGFVEARTHVDLPLTNTAMLI